MYQKITEKLIKYIKPATLYKTLFNWSPMYRRSTGKIIAVSDDMHQVTVKIPLSWKNKNYVGSIFGGSMLSATDPIYMIMYIQILGKDYVVWDKATTSRFKIPAREHIYIDFITTVDEINYIKKTVAEKGEIDIVKKIYIQDKSKTKTFAEIEKTIYIADKNYYKSKKKELNRI